MPIEKDEIKQIGEILADLRTEKRLTQKELGEELHISNSSISSFENGSRMLGANFIIAYSKYFKVPADYLLALSDSSMSPSVLNEKVSDGVTVKCLVDMIRKLSPKQKEAAVIILRDMSSYADIVRKAGKDEDNQQ